MTLSEIALVLVMRCLFCVSSEPRRRYIRLRQSFFEREDVLISGQWLPLSLVSLISSTSYLMFSSTFSRFIRCSSSLMSRCYIMLCRMFFMFLFLDHFCLFVELMPPPESVRQTDMSMRDFELPALLAWCSIVFEFDISFFLEGFWH